MFKKLIPAGLLILIIALISGPASTQYNYIPAYMDNYYASLPQGLQAARAVYITTEYIEADRDFASGRKYIRPSDYEPSESLEEMDYITEEQTNLMSMQPPPVSSKTTIGVAPFGFLTYSEKSAYSNNPIRDFRREYWTSLNYDDEPQNQTAGYDAEER